MNFLKSLGSTNVLVNTKFVSYEFARYASSLPSLKIYSLRRRLAEKLSNKYDLERVQEIGPDLACLEWLMECGSTRVIMNDQENICSIRQMKEYISFALNNNTTQNTRPSALPNDTSYVLKWKHVPPNYIVNVDASDSAIANEGFQYFRDLRMLSVLKLNFCDYFGDEALRELALGRPAQTLSDIEIVLNPSITDGSVYWISRLKALRRAHFYFLPYISNRQAFVRQLKTSVPKCKVTFPEIGNIGYGYSDKK
ncbi:unnamed protein product [Auanema sp. JU1783]|nr:unnamed protein product [Auanema sp. JU1783]